MPDLQVTTTNSSRWGRILTIEFPRAEYESERGRIARELRRRVARPGFRKGKVPVEIIEKEFGERIHADTLEKLIPDVCTQAIEQEKLDVISTPSLKTLDLENPESVRLEVELDIRPTIQLQPLEGLRANRWKPEVTDADRDRALQSVREERAEFVAVDRDAGDGDVVIVSYVPVDEAGNPRNDQQVENYPFQLGEGQVVAEFEAAVRGRKAGDTTRVEVRYPDNHSDPDLAGKLVAMVLTVKEIKEKRLPDLDDDLARDLDLDDLDDLRRKVSADLERRLAEEADRDLDERLVDALVAAHPLEPPQSMVDAYVAAVLRDYDERHRQMRVEPDAERRKQVEESARPAAERAVQRALLLEEIKKQHDLQTTEADVDKWIEERVEAGGPEAKKLRALFADPKRRRRLRGELAEKKVFDFLKSKAVITEVPRPAVT